MQDGNPRVVRAPMVITYMEGKGEVCVKVRLSACEAEERELADSWGHQEAQMEEESAERWEEPCRVVRGRGQSEEKRIQLLCSALCLVSTAFCLKTHRGTFLSFAGLCLVPSIPQEQLSVQSFL